MGIFHPVFVAMLLTVATLAAVFVYKFFLQTPVCKIRIGTISGPSGSGKTTIVGELLKRHPEWRLVVSLTSRESRERDLPGEYKCNLSIKLLYQLYREGKTLWLKNEHGNIYVTLLESVEKARRSRVLSFMQILPKSVVKLLAYLPGQVLPIFIIPPDEKELRRRLAARGESPETIERRVADCRRWEEEARSSDIPYEFVENNSTVPEAVEEVEAILRRYGLCV